MKTEQEPRAEAHQDCLSLSPDERGALSQDQRPLSKNPKLRQGRGRLFFPPPVCQEGTNRAHAKRTERLGGAPAEARVLAGERPSSPRRGLHHGRYLFEPTPPRSSHPRGATPRLRGAVRRTGGGATAPRASLRDRERGHGARVSCFSFSHITGTLGTLQYFQK